MDDRACAVPREQVLDEAAVDLQLVEREALQIAQGRIAGAEVVERDAHAEASEPMEQAQRFSSLKEDRFGNFDLEAAGRQATVGKRAKDALVQRPAMELNRRHVD